MDIGLALVPRRTKRLATPGLKGMDYARQVALCRDLTAGNARFVDYVLKPATDEMWNLIDGRRSVAEIVEDVLLEFDLNTDPRLWLPVFEGWRRAGLIELEAEGGSRS